MKPPRRKSVVIPSPIADVVINEFAAHEYIVIQNDSASAVELWNAEGPWRINGIGYTLPSNTVIGAGASLTIVAFDPGDT